MKSSRTQTRSGFLLVDSPRRTQNRTRSLRGAPQHDRRRSVLRFTTRWEGVDDSGNRHINRCPIAHDSKAVTKTASSAKRAASIVPLTHRLLLLTDGLRAEPRACITIYVSLPLFRHPRRKFIIATPRGLASVPRATWVPPAPPPRTFAVILVACSRRASSPDPAHLVRAFTARSRDSFLAR